MMLTDPVLRTITVLKQSKVTVILTKHRSVQQYRLSSRELFKDYWIRHDRQVIHGEIIGCNVARHRTDRRRMSSMSSSSRICRFSPDRNAMGTRYGLICFGTNSGVVTMRWVTTSQRPGLSEKQAENSSSTSTKSARWPSSRWAFPARL